MSDTAVWLLTVLRLASEPSGYLGAKCFIAFFSSACSRHGSRCRSECVGLHIRRALSVCGWVAGCVCVRVCVHLNLLASNTSLAVACWCCQTGAPCAWP